MKIRCFKAIKLSNKVEALELSSAEVDLAYALEHRIVDLPYRSYADYDLLSTVPEEALLQAIIEETDENESFAICPLKVKKKGKVLSFQGVLLYSSPYHLADFLFSDYVPSNLTEIDNFLQRHRRKRSDKTAKTKLAEMIDDAGGEGFMRRRKRHMKFFPAMKFDASRMRSLTFWKGKGNAAYYLYSAGGPRLFILEGSVKSGRKNIPVWSFFYQPEERKEKGVFWDGGKASVMAVEALGEQWLQAVKERGRIKAFQGEDVFPRPDLEVEFALRVPAKQETGKYATDDKLDSIKPLRTYSHPLYLKESTEAVEVPENVQLVDSVEDALYILARTRERVFVPGDLVVNPIEGMGKRAHYLLAMRVRDEGI